METVPLARLLAMAMRAMVDEIHDGLRSAGHPDLRPAHGFVLNAVGATGTTAGELAALLGMTKQGAAKIVDTLVALGYVRRREHSVDRRARLLTLTARGQAALTEAVAVQRRVERQWAERLGQADMAVLRRCLEASVAAGPGGEPPPLRPVW